MLTNTDPVAGEFAGTINELRAASYEIKPEALEAWKLTDIHTPEASLAPEEILATTDDDEIQVDDSTDVSPTLTTTEA